MQDLSVAVVNSILEYDPDTGKLTWRERSLEMFSSDRTRKMWNKRWAGKEAFTSVLNGYRQGRIFGQHCYAHRIIWLMTHGALPDEIDHINGNKSDNRLQNLRDVDHKRNMQSHPRRRATKAIYPGVRYDAKWKKWRVEIGSGTNRKHMGSYDCTFAAIMAKRAEENLRGYHALHGR